MAGKVLLHRTFLVLATLQIGLVLSAAEKTFTVQGRLLPKAQASVTLAGATTPYNNSTLTTASGEFRFRKIEAGTYTLSAFVPARGEIRQTIVVSPSTADRRNRVRIEIAMEGPQLRREDVGKVSVRSLSIPEGAMREYERAANSLKKRDVEAAEAHLHKAVEIAPHYAEAWNYLGTLAYQTQRYPLAEEMFRRSLEEDNTLYAPLVNLGGVLITLGRLKEAEGYNRHAVLREPGDALAYSQLGMNLLDLDRLDEAEKYLRTAIELDPAHFSHPQLVLADVLARKGKFEEIPAVLEHFLKYHPDHPAASQIREQIEKLVSAGR